MTFDIGPATVIQTITDISCPTELQNESPPPRGLAPPLPEDVGLPGHVKGEPRTQNRGEGTGFQPTRHAETTVIATIRGSGDEGAEGGK